MNQLVESLKRLFLNGKIDKNKLKKMVEDNKITSKEYNYIINH